MISDEDFELTYEPDDTVEVLKNKIKDEKLFDPKIQKLFYTFIPMDNHQLIKEYLEEGERVFAKFVLWINCNLMYNYSWVIIINLKQRNV